MNDIERIDWWNKELKNENKESIIEKLKSYIYGPKDTIPFPELLQQQKDIDIIIALGVSLFYRGSIVESTKDGWVIMNDNWIIKDWNILQDDNGIKYNVIDYKVIEKLNTTDPYLAQAGVKNLGTTKFTCLVLDKTITVGTHLFYNYRQ